MTHPLMQLPRWAQSLVAVVLTMVMVAAGLQPAGPYCEGFLFELLFLIAVIALNEVLKPKPKIEDARPAGIGDFQFPTASEGRPVPIVFGRCRQKGPNVVWYGDLKQEAITEKLKTGLWSSTRVVKGFRYHLGVQFAISRGSNTAPIVLKRAWIGDTEVFNGTVSGVSRFDIDEPDLFGGEDLGNGGVRATCDFFPGTTTQAVSTYLDTTDRQRIATAITPTAPRYTGTCYVLARELTSADATAADAGAYIGNSTSVRPWSFEVERFPAIFSGQSASDHKIGATDCNPMNVAYELITDGEWGFGDGPTDVDLVAFKAAADTLRTEGAGFSFLMDRQMQAQDLKAELERHIDGVIFEDPVTGKWTVTLARDDYTIGGVPQLTDSNVAEVRDYTRGSWEDTTNNVVVQYFKRDDDYKESYALAQDMANSLIQGGGTLATAGVKSAKMSFPGIKDSTYAAVVAWRELRTQAYPLARCTLVLNRENWDLRLGSVVAWTNARLGFVQLPMRVLGIDYGRRTDGKMSVRVVQDTFRFAAASMAAPGATNWDRPVVGLVAFPANEQLAFEAPRAIVVRDPDFGGDDTAGKLFCAAARQGGETAYAIQQRNASGALSGSFFDSGDGAAFMLMGALTADLQAGTAVPTTTITVAPDASSQTAIEEAFDDGSTAADLGVDLAQLIYVGGEFMLVTSAANSGGNVNLQTVYRGVLDTAQSFHASGSKVYMVFAGAALADAVVPNTNNVEVRLRMRSAAATFAGTVTTIGFTMDKRAIRPYPPAAPRYNGSGTSYGTPNLEGSGSGLDGSGFSLLWLRRRFNCTDEVAAKTSDDSTVTASTEYQARVFVDPDGANVEIASSPFVWSTANTVALVNRLEILELAPAGTEIRVRVETRHDILSETNLEAAQDMDHDVVPTSALTGKFYLGGLLGPNVVTNLYTTVATGTFTVNIGSLWNSQIQYRINAGAFVNLTGYTPGVSLTGTIAGVTSGDTIELRHQTNPGSPDRTFIELRNPSSVLVAYGVLSKT